MQNKDNICEPDTTLTEQGSVMDCQNGKENNVHGSTDLGKFKDVNALMQAYTSLQAEFTRRSQRLKRLEDEENQRRESLERETLSGESKADAPLEPLHRPDSAEEENVDLNLSKEFESVESTSKEEKTMMTTVEQTSLQQDGAVNKNNSLSLYEQALADENVRLKIVADYLSSLGKSNAPLLQGGTGVLVTPVKKPASIAEAGKMTLAYWTAGKR